MNNTTHPHEAANPDASLAITGKIADPILGIAMSAEPDWLEAQSSTNPAADWLEPDAEVLSYEVGDCPEQYISDEMQSLFDEMHKEISSKYQEQYERFEQKFPFSSDEQCLIAYQRAMACLTEPQKQVGRIAHVQTKTEITFSVITASNPKHLSKSYSLDAKGGLVKKPGGHLVDGMVKTMKVSGLSEFAAVLNTANSAMAFIYGTTQHPEATVTTRANLEKANSKRKPGDSPIIARDRNHFAFQAEPGILMLDFDPLPGEAALSPDEARERIYSVWPALEEAPHMLVHSSSAHIYNEVTNKEERGAGGLHGYVLVADATQIPRLGATLVKKLWQAGYGKIVFSKSGAMLERTVIDAAVWQPERLDFVSGSYCESPLVQRKPAPVSCNPDAAPIDASTLPDLTEDECKEVSLMIRNAKGLPAVIKKSGEITAQWVDVRVKETLKKKPKKNAEAVRKAFERAVKHHELAGDFPILLPSGVMVTVDELLDNPDKYHNERCAEPLEPDYGNDPRIALISLKASSPFIYSHAHGGIRYKLQQRPKDILLLPGEIHVIISDILSVLRRDASIYERGGEIVRVTETGEVFAVIPEWLSVYLTRVANFKRLNKKSGYLPADCPLDVAKRVLAMRGEWNLPQLDAVLTAPIITPDGRILDEHGYDSGTKALVMLKNVDHPSVPLAPTLAQVVDALKYLWEPFKNFPFVSPADESVFLAALLTAVMRPLLPTAPAFLLAAPTAGSGKTLLIKCLAGLMGVDNPALMPPTNNEEEIRKRVLAALREGKATLVFDNVVGHLDSATICVLLTTTQYSDRVLGSSATLTVPTNALFLASGNNVILVGDLNRRFLTCTIDPKTDKAYRRTFTLNPADFVRQNRQKMVAAALTILQGYRTFGTKQKADRTASFEDWSDLVRQAVMWVGIVAGRDFPDPCDSIDDSYDQDPETRKLESLLESWYKLFGPSPKKIQQVIRMLPKPDQCLDDGPLAQLYDAVDEIAGERGVVNSRRLGRWIEKMKGRVCGNKKFVLVGRAGGTNVWTVNGA